MKPLLTVLIVIAFLSSSLAATPPAGDRTITDIKVIPTRVLQRSISPKFYKTLLVSPIQGWIVVRGHLSGTRLSGMRVVRSELNGLYDPLALKLAKDVQIAGRFLLEKQHITSPVLLHLLIYQIADGTMALSFAHLDEPGGNQMEYYGCARLSVLKKDGRWDDIKGPESLEGKGVAVRQGIRNDLSSSLKLEMRSMAAESVNGGRN